MPLMKYSIFLKPVGPIIADDHDKTPLSLVWTALQPGAINLKLIELEQVKTTDQAVKLLNWPVFQYRILSSVIEMEISVGRLRDVSPPVPAVMIHKYLLIGPASLSVGTVGWIRLSTHSSTTTRIRNDYGRLIRGLSPVINFNSWEMAATTWEQGQRKFATIYLRAINLPLQICKQFSLIIAHYC